MSDPVWRFRSLVANLLQTDDLPSIDADVLQAHPTLFDDVRVAIEREDIPEATRLARVAVAIGQARRRRRMPS